MAIYLILMRDPVTGNSAISLEEWLETIEMVDHSRPRIDPYSAVNQVTATVIRINVGQEASEVMAYEEWAPFLYWKDGQLITKYHPEIKNSAD